MSGTQSPRLSLVKSERSLLPYNRPMPATTPKTSGRRSEARERLLANASKLFYAEGINSVGVDRIVAESNVTLATLYRHFPSKGDLAVSYLEAAHASLVARAEDGAEGLEGRELIARIGAEVVAELGMEGYRGCAFINASAEFEDPSSPVRAAVAEHRRWYLDRIRRAFADAGHKRPGNAARHFVMLRDGAVASACLDSPTAAQRTFKRGVDGLIRVIDIDHSPDDVDEG
jgi:AcrR family transcriptional regulator